MKSFLNTRRNWSLCRHVIFTGLALWLAACTQTKKIPETKSTNDAYMPAILEPAPVPAPAPAPAAAEKADREATDSAARAEYIDGSAVLSRAEAQPRTTQALIGAQSRNNAQAANTAKPANGAQASNAARAAEPVQAAIDSRLTAYSVVCANPNECPGFIAQLIVKETDGHLATCTGFLLNSDTLMTNSHCIPTDLKSPGSACFDRIVFNFPKSGKLPAESAGCQSVTKATVLSGNSSMDYAIVRLNRKVSRVNTTTSQEGVQDGGFYRLAKVDPPENGSRSGTLHVVTCETIQNTELLLNFDNPRAEQIYLDDCPIVGGNSGSPLLKPGSDTAVALLQSGIRRERIQELSLILQEAVAKKKGVGFGTNLACIPEVSASGTANCQPGKPDLTGHIPRAEQERLDREQNIKIYSALAAASNIVGWKVADLPNNERPDNAGRRYHQAATPVCLQPAHFWIAKINRGEFKFQFDAPGPIFKRASMSNGQVDAYYDNMIWAFRPILSPRLRQTYEPVTFVFENFVVSFKMGATGWDGEPVTINGKQYRFRECSTERQPPAIQAKLRELTDSRMALAR
ncbi:MAG: trypsin-like peptidase domain-containing protein [Bdellovibrionia bacterium]